jgi:hypothetical protein
MYVATPRSRDRFVAVVGTSGDYNETSNCMLLRAQRVRFDTTVPRVIGARRIATPDKATLPARISRCRSSSAAEHFSNEKPKLCAPASRTGLPLSKEK